MATKYVKLKIKTATGFDLLYPATHMDQVEGLAGELLSVYAAIGDKLDKAGGEITGGLTISGSVASGGTDFGYYQNAGTNLILKGDASGRSGIFFQSEKNETNINHPSDYGFIQFHSYGYGGSAGEANALVLGVANDSTDIVVLQTPYNGGVKLGFRDATSGTGLTLQTVATREWVEAQDFAAGDYLPIDGTAVKATILETARTINIGTAVSATATSFNGSANITIPINGISEAYLTWGGKNLAGQVTPIGMSLSNEHSANRLAFINGDSLYFEYSSDGGSTWADYGYSASQKSQFCTLSLGVPIGRLSGEYTVLSRTRITLTAQNGTTGYVYTNPRKMLLEISSSGGMQVLVETRTGTNYQSDGAWSTVGTYTLSGWSGWNDIPLVLGTLGGGTTQTGNNWQLRLTFIMTSRNDTYPTTAFVNKLRIYGENAWSVPSNLAGTNNLYSFDMSQNVSFPGTLQATQLKSTIATGTAPLTVVSTTLITNLNSDMLDGYHYNNLPYRSSSWFPSWADVLSKPTYTSQRILLGQGTDEITVLAAGATGQFLKGVSSGIPIWGTIAEGDVPNLPASKINSGTFDSARIPGLDASKIISGTIDAARLPAIAIVDRHLTTTLADFITNVYSLDTQGVQKGDIIICTSEKKTYIHNGGTAGTSADFNVLETPLDSVTSVAGKTGVVTLVKGDVGLGNVQNLDQTNPANITQSASYRFVTDTEKSTWDAKLSSITKAMVEAVLTGAISTHTHNDYLKYNPDGDGIVIAYDDSNPTIDDQAVGGGHIFGADGNMSNGYLAAKVLFAEGVIHSIGGLYVGSMTRSAGGTGTKVIDSVGKLFYQGNDIDARYLLAGATAVNSDKVDGIHASSFLQKSGGTMTDDITMEQDGASGAARYSHGIIFKSFRSIDFVEISRELNMHPDGNLLFNGTAIILEGDARLTNSRPASDVYTWAKAATKPSYAFSEITSKPTTLSGYGITDGAVNFGSRANTATTTADFIALLTSWGMFGVGHAFCKFSWSYAGNANITDITSGSVEIAGAVCETWQNGDGTKMVRLICPNTGSGNAYREFIYNDQGSGYSPGWREVWNSRTLSAGTQAEIEAGTETAQRTWAPNILKAAIQALSDLDTNNYPSSLSFNTADGILTLGRNGLASLTVDLDGRYLTSETSHADVVVDGDVTVTATANKIVQRDANGYIYGVYINSSRGNEATAAASYIYDSGDGWLRKKTLANAQTELVTKAAIEAALTGAITTHTHAYLPNSGAATLEQHAALGSVVGSVNTLQILQSTASNDAFMTFHIANDYAVHFGLDYATNDLFVGGWSMGANKFKIWHQNNDGAGSGLDADLLDGNHASAFALASHTHSYLPLTGGTLTGNLTLDHDTPVGGQANSRALVFTYQDISVDYTKALYVNPSGILVFDGTGVILGSGTANQIAYFSAAGTIASLSTGTYPSLTELSYVKGVSSAIQTQLNGKAPIATPTFTTADADLVIGSVSNKNRIQSYSTGTPIRFLNSANGYAVIAADDLKLGDSISVKNNMAYRTVYGTALSANTSITTTYANKFVRCTNGAGVNITLTIGTGFTVGDEIHFSREGVGEVTIALSSGTLNSESSKRRINALYQVVTAKYVAANVWLLFGALKT